MRIPKPGDRIRLVAMIDDPNTISVSATGTVNDARKHGSDANEWYQVDID